mmetsp:Transcript_37509/g.71879  ORF Transcript_37509/g.71879 Transcript_37509/m.71879 type:complete len:203 (+) Transcript_37509:1843-2451(+)
MLLQDVRVLNQLGVRLRQVVLQLLYGLRGANASHNVLALRVDKVLPIQLVLAGGRIASETHTRPGRVPHVAKHHRLDVDCSAGKTFDVLNLTVENGAITHPRIKHRKDAKLHLLERVQGETLAFLLVHTLVDLNQFFEVFDGEVIVIHHALCLLKLSDLMLEKLVVNPHHNAAKHVQEPTVRVICKSLVPRFSSQPFHHIII